MESESDTVWLPWNVTDSTAGNRGNPWQLEDELTTGDWSGKDEDEKERTTPPHQNRSHDDNWHMSMPHLLDQQPVDVLMHGYVTPVLILVTVLTNSMVCVVLLRKEIRTATNCLLVAMAISDMLTGVLPLPCFLYFYTAGHYSEWVPFGWCFAYLCLTDYLPTVTHTASIWLTVALASQRFICVRHSYRAKNLCTVRNTVKVVCVVYACAFLSHCNRFFEHQFYPVTVRSRVDPMRTVTSCRYDFTPFVLQNIQLYFNVYFWYRVVFIHVVPCLSLVALNAVLVWTIREAEMKRRILQNRSECRRLMESNATTMMLVVVVGVLVLVELPLAVLFVIMILENTLSIAIVSVATTKLSTLVVNLVILLSYPLNFFIYCGMSQQFRDTFHGLFRRRRRHVHERQPCGGGRGGGGDLERSDNGSEAITSGCHGNNRNKSTCFLQTTTV